MTFNEKDIELIERYLQGDMAGEELRQFETRMNAEYRLLYETKLIAYMMHSLNEVGMKRDNERIRLMLNASTSDTKKYILSIAAMFIGVVVFAAVVSVPVYRSVIKPLIEQSHVQELQTRPNNGINIWDTLAVDSVGTDTVGVSDEAADKPAITNAVKEKPDSPKVEKVIDKTQPETEVVRQNEREQEPPQEESAERPVAAQPTPAPVVKKVNKIVSYGTLEGYKFGSVKAVKNGNVVTCTFTMMCEHEDAEIQMHSARAKDNTGKDYSALNCLLNGKQTRIKEKWKAGEIHDITIQIKDVSADVTALTSVSFSFQSKTKSREQKSMPIVLQVESF